MGKSGGGEGEWVERGKRMRRKRKRGRERMEAGVIEREGRGNYRKGKDEEIRKDCFCSVLSVTAQNQGLRIP